MRMNFRVVFALGFMALDYVAQEVTSTVREYRDLATEENPAVEENRAVEDPQSATMSSPAADPIHSNTFVIRTDRMGRTFHVPRGGLSLDVWWAGMGVFLLVMASLLWSTLYISTLVHSILGYDLPPGLGSSLNPGIHFMDCVHAVVQETRRWVLEFRGWWGG